MTIIPAITSGIRAVKENIELYEENNFDNRADAIDFIEFHLLSQIEEWLLQHGAAENLLALKQQAEDLKHALEVVDLRLFDQLREKIKAGDCRGPSFINMVADYTGYDMTADMDAPEIGYDNLDIFINGLLLTGDMPEPVMELEPEMVFYQKTPARVIFQLAAQVKQDDVFIDLGAGLGQVNMLVHLISSAASVGIECEPAYCDYAAGCAAALNLRDVAFIHTDARKADYATGTIFFMYTPFSGGMMEEVLDKLRKESEKRAIRIFTYGPCSAQLAGQEWLSCIVGQANDPYQLCEFRRLSTAYAD